MAGKADVGGKIARIREARKLSQAELAERSQVALEELRQIEEGALIPSLTPLTKIARVLGVRMGTFLDDVEQVGPVLNRKGRIKQTVRFAGGSQPARGELQFHALALDKAGRHMEPFLIDVLPASDKSYEMSSHEGEEFLYVLGGGIELLYGKDTYLLAEGDSIYYDSIVAHHVHASGEAPARILAVVYAPF
ncbi:MAG TPA: XRE family transcriptional regulator [Vicinamibacteria bacterium]|nr:XRE family transcriptional regulator [Vicinamibacteria bacterium]